jgi:hypothetical protein
MTVLLMYLCTAYWMCSVLTEVFRRFPQRLREMLEVYLE